MKKIVCILLLTSGLSFGADAPQKKSSSTQEHIPTQKNLNLLNITNKKDAKLFLVQYQSIFSGATLFFLGSLFRIRRPIALLGAGICGLSYWNPKLIIKYGNKALNIASNLSYEALDNFETSTENLNKRVLEKKQQKKDNNKNN